MNKVIHRSNYFIDAFRKKKVVIYLRGKMDQPNSGRYFLVGIKSSYCDDHHVFLLYVVKN